MSDNSERDIRMSLRYYIARHLRAYEPKYDVRMAIEEDAWERPCAVVQTAGPVIPTNVGYRIASNIRPFVAYVYPARGENPKLAELEAARVESVLKAAIQKGGHDGRPARVPVFDFDDIPDEGGEEEWAELEASGDPMAYLTIMDASVDHKADPDDETLQTVWINIRLRWRAKGEEYKPSTTLQSVGVDSGKVS